MEKGFPQAPFLNLLMIFRHQRDKPSDAEKF